MIEKIIKVEENKHISQDLCELKKRASMLYIADADKALQQFPECIVGCEGYDKGCARYVPKVVYNG